MKEKSMAEEKTADAESVAARVRIKWESNASLRADFGNSFDRYAAYRNNQTLVVIDGGYD